MKTCGIYRFLNTINGKSYVGSSINLKARHSLHLTLLRKGKSHSSKLQNAYNKHGESVFVFEVLEECECAELEERETAWIRKLNAVSNGYNTSDNVRAPTRGFKHTVETRLRMSEAQKMANQSELRKKTAGARLTAYNKTLKGKPQTEEHRRKIGEARKGIKHSPETIEKMKRRVISEVHRAALQGRKHTAEARRKISEAKKGKIGASHNRSVLIHQLSKDGQIVTHFHGAEEASRITGIGRSNIKNCLRGYSKTAGGYKWRYADADKR